MLHKFINSSGFWKSSKTVLWIQRKAVAMKVSKFESIQNNFRTSPSVPPAPPKRQGSHLSSGITSGFAAPVETHDQVRVYALEDTPLNFSTATSLSDLTVDEAVNSGRVSVDSQDGLIQHHPQNQNQRWVLILWQTLQNFLEGNVDFPLNRNSMNRQF